MFKKHKKKFKKKTQNLYCEKLKKKHRTQI